MWSPAAASVSRQYPASCIKSATFQPDSAPTAAASPLVYGVAPKVDDNLSIPGIPGIPGNDGIPAAGMPAMTGTTDDVGAGGASPSGVAGAAGGAGGGQYVARAVSMYGPICAILRRSEDST